jgi:hypothetical protein
MTDRDTALREAAEEYLRLADGPKTADHEMYCEYLRRSPAMESDCDCGAFRRFREDGEDAADKLARAALATEASEGLVTLVDPQDRWRLVRVGTEALSQFGTRTEDGRRITAEWGEPDALGIYEPIFTAATDPNHPTAECPEPDCRKVADHSGPHFPVPGDGTPDSLRGGPNR